MASTQTTIKPRKQASRPHDIDSGSVGVLRVVGEKNPQNARQAVFDAGAEPPLPSASQRKIVLELAWRLLNECDTELIAGWCDVFKDYATGAPPAEFEPQFSDSEFPLEAS